MHELSLIYQVVKTVDEVMSEKGLTQLEQITLDIGEMTDVVPEFIEAAWQSAKQAVNHPDTRLMINVIRAKSRCNSCGYTDYVKNFGYECPKCKSDNLKILCGREFEIKEIIAK